MKQTYVLSMFFAFAAVGAAQTVAPGQTVPVPIAIQLPAPTYNFGVVGLGLGQNLRVVVSNIATPPTISTTPSPACGVTVKFFDLNGAAVGQGGQIASLDYGKSFAVEQTGPTSGRVEYRVQVQAVYPTTTTTGTGIPVRLLTCDLLSTVQVYDTATGKTDILLSGTPLIAGSIGGILPLGGMGVGASRLP